MRRISFVLVFLMVCSFVFGMVSFAEPNDVSNAVLMTNHDGVRLRDAAGRSNIIAVIKKKGTALEYIDTVYVEDVLWYHIRVEGVEGYVYGEYVNVDYNADPSGVVVSDSNQRDPNKVYLVTLGEKLNLRDWPNGKLLTTIYGAGSVMEMLKPSQLNRETWYYVRYGDYDGYVFASYCKIYKGDVLPGDSVLRMVDDDSGLSENADSIRTVVENVADGIQNMAVNSMSSAETPVVDPLTGEVESMGDVAENAVSASVGAVDHKVYLVTTGYRVNFRKSPSIDGDVITNIVGVGTQVEALDPSRIGLDSWYHVMYNGVEGYVSAKYLKIDDSPNVSESVQSEPFVETTDDLVDGTSDESFGEVNDNVDSVDETSVEVPVELTYGTVETSVDVELSDEDVSLHSGHRR